MKFYKFLTMLIVLAIVCMVSGVLGDRLYLRLKHNGKMKVVDTLNPVMGGKILDTCYTVNVNSGHPVIFVHDTTYIPDAEDNEMYWYDARGVHGGVGTVTTMNAYHKINDTIYCKNGKEHVAIIKSKSHRFSK